MESNATFDVEPDGSTVSPEYVAEAARRKWHPRWIRRLPASQQRPRSDAGIAFGAQRAPDLNVAEAVCCTDQCSTGNQDTTPSNNVERLLEALDCPDHLDGSCRCCLVHQLSLG